MRISDWSSDVCSSDLGGRRVPWSCRALPRGIGALRPGLQSVQIIDGPLRVGGGLEDGPLVVLQDLEPGGHIGGMIRADLWRDTEVGAEKSRADLGDQLLAGVAFVAPPLAPQIAVEPGRVARPVGELMGQGRRVALRIDRKSTRLNSSH